MSQKMPQPDYAAVAFSSDLLGEYEYWHTQSELYEHHLPVIALGIGGEAGEVQEKIKKHFRGDYDLHLDADKREELKKELGDLLWYLTRNAHYFGFTLGEVADGNRQKLIDRDKRGVRFGNGDNR
jgi:NTP pyrophosphatase (non-canonical NTP hydrolase)